MSTVFTTVLISAIVLLAVSFIGLTLYIRHLNRTQPGWDTHAGEQGRFEAGANSERYKPTLDPAQDEAHRAYWHRAGGRRFWVSRSRCTCSRGKRNDQCVQHGEHPDMMRRY